jgi:N4-gp56 family major capsid protein
MAKTVFTSSNALTKKAWEEKLYRDTLKDSYFSRFMGEDAKSLVQVKTELTKTKGDNITFGIRMRLAGAGVTSGTILEGNEEKLTTYDFNISLEQYRHGVRDNGELDRQRAVFSIDEESRAALQGWGSEKVDELCSDAIHAAPTKIFYGGAATSTADIAAGDKLTPALISKAKTWALGGGGRSQTPLRPIRINGKNYLVLLVHGDVMYDLKQDTTFSQARREALERGKDNPIFSGAEAIWDGVVIHEHENVPIVTNWGAGGNIAGAKCVLMGAQSLCFAWGKRPRVVQKTFDYDNEHGYGWGMICRVGKPVFNTKDYGSIAVYVSRTLIN